MSFHISPELGRKKRAAWEAYKSIEDEVKKMKSSRSIPLHISEGRDSTFCSTSRIEATTVGPCRARLGFTQYQAHYRKSADPMVRLLHTFLQRKILRSSCPTRKEKPMRRLWCAINKKGSVQCRRRVEQIDKQQESSDPGDWN
ncbi:hypothetical protein RB195_007383 [Necator americanus]|uniref:Uncharacterized protein n=1 Tax=Necator americanus TaxID=51031 RepID=A0ABR1BZI8_NECAM